MSIHLQSRRAFLKSAATLAAGAPMLARAERAPRPLMAYLGTYSSPLKKVPKGQVDLPAGNGRGIHLFQVDRATGALTASGVFEMPNSPSCLAINAAGTRLYSANETDKGDDDAGTVSAFAIDPADGQLKLLNTVSSGGAGPTYVSVHPSGKFVLVANYFGGSVAVFPILPEGGLGPACDFRQDTGTPGPKTAKNAPPGSFAFSGHEVPHAHMIETDPTGQYVVVPDLGLDQIIIWKFEEATGKLTPNDPPHVALPPGDGPRHFDFHPNQRWFYSIQEEGSNIVFFEYDSAHGRLAAKQTISSLPPGFAGSNFCSEIRVSKDGRFVYAGNRLHDGIACFAVGDSGTLSFVSEEWTRGDYPRSFSFDPTGSFLYSCNQRADHVTAFRVDKQTGGLTFTGQYTPVGNPSMIAFLDLDRRP